jgi:hypothetical protein
MAATRDRAKRGPSAGFVAAIHTLRLEWVFMGRRDKPGDDELVRYVC